MKLQFVPGSRSACVHEDGNGVLQYKPYNAVRGCTTLCGTRNKTALPNVREYKSQAEHMGCISRSQTLAIWLDDRRLPFTKEFKDQQLGQATTS